MHKLRGMGLLAAVLVAAGFEVLVPANAAEVITGTDVREMRSDAGRRYQIFTARPLQPAPAEGYAVIYVLDANIMFGTMVDAARSFARRPYGRPTLVVGIGYPPDLDPVKERSFDLTPSLTADPPADAGTGGAEDFLDFIERRLKPDIAARFPVDPANETLFGHSYGGLFTLYALVNEPAAFDNFVAASPSIWFEGRLLQKANVRGRLGPKLRATQAVPRVLITAGEFEQVADPSLPVPAGRGATPEVLKERAQVDNGREFVAFLDDDDIWIDDPLAEHVAVLQAHPDAAAVFSQGYLADEHLNPVYGPFPKPPLPQGDAFIWSLGTTLPMGAAVYRRSALEAVGGFDESLTSAEDNDIQLRLTARFDLFGIERSTVLWRQHPHRNVAYTAWRAHFAPFDRMMARNTRLPARVRVSARQRLRAHLQHRGWSAAYAVTQAGQWLADGDLAESGKFLWGAVYASPLHALLRIRAFWTTLARWGYTVAVRRLRRTAFASTTQSR